MTVHTESVKYFDEMLNKRVFLKIINLQLQKLFLVPEVVIQTFENSTGFSKL